jgi:hypothetical protein
VHYSQHVAQLHRAHRGLLVIRRGALAAQVGVVYSQVRPQPFQGVDLFPPAAVALVVRHRVVRQLVQLSFG